MGFGQGERKEKEEEKEKERDPLLLVLFIHGFINGWIKDVLIWGFALVGWFTVLLKIKKEVL